MSEIFASIIALGNGSYGIIFQGLLMEIFTVLTSLLSVLVKTKCNVINNVFDQINITINHCA